MLIFEPEATKTTKNYFKTTFFSVSNNNDPKVKNCEEMASNESELIQFSLNGNKDAGKPIIHTLRSRNIVVTSDGSSEEEESEYSYKSEDFVTPYKNRRCSSSSETISIDIDDESGFENEEDEDRLIVDPEVFVIEESSKSVEIVEDAYSEIENTVIVKEEIDIEDYSFYTDEELGNSIGECILILFFFSYLPT